MYVCSQAVVVVACCSTLYAGNISCQATRGLYYQPQQLAPTKVILRLQSDPTRRPAGGKSWQQWANGKHWTVNLALHDLIKTLVPGTLSDTQYMATMQN